MSRQLSNAFVATRHSPSAFFQFLQDQRWQYIGLPAATDFTFSRQDAWGKCFWRRDVCWKRLKLDQNVQEPISNTGEFDTVITRLGVPPDAISQKLIASGGAGPTATRWSGLAGRFLDGSVEWWNTFMHCWGISWTSPRDPKSMVLRTNQQGRQ